MRDPIRDCFAPIECVFLCFDWFEDEIDFECVAWMNEPLHGAVRLSTVAVTNSGKSTTLAWRCTFEYSDRATD